MDRNASHLKEYNNKMTQRDTRKKTNSKIQKQNHEKENHNTR